MGIRLQPKEIEAPPAEPFLKMLLASDTNNEVRSRE